MTALNTVAGWCQSEKTLWQLFIEQRGLMPIGDCMNLLDCGGERLSLDNYPSLWQWPSDELEGFWACTGECFDSISPASFIAVLARQSLLPETRNDQVG